MCVYLLPGEQGWSSHPGNYGLGVLKVVEHAVKPEVKRVRENDPKMDEGK
jgi:hypothetical protein